MKQIFISLIMTAAIACGSPAAFAAPKKTPEQIKVEAIVNDPDSYIYGEGYGSDPEEAYNAAVLDMVRKISVTISGRSVSDVSESIAADGSHTSTMEFNSVVESYTAPASLEGVQVVAVANGPEFSRFVYMDRSKIEQMQRRRLNNVADLARSGVRARDAGNIDGALRSLYRSYVLLQSLPSPSTVTETIDGEPRVLANWLPQAMREIVSKLKFGIASVRDDETDPAHSGKIVELNVSYDGSPATSASFKYGTASGYSSLITARDGMAVIELSPSVPLNPLNLYVEYLFKNENHSDRELEPLLRSFNGAGLVDNRITLTESARSLKADKKETKAFQQAVAAGSHESLQPLDKDAARPYAEAMGRIVTAISMQAYRDIDDLFTPAGRQVFDKLISYGRARIMGKASRDTYEFYPFRGNIMCRSVPMSFTFEGGRRQFTEDVTFTFNPEGKVESVGFSLGSVTRHAIFEQQGDAWTDDKKLTLANFLENYRTAFALGAIDYIESIFDDEAVIIVGHVTKRLERVAGGSGDGFGMTQREHVTYARKSKREYIEQLRRCFASQEYINIRFSDTDVMRSGIGGETFAVQLKQDYVSKTYGDQGYLYLFVDFNDPDRPLIKIRTWQPERNPDLTPNLPMTHPRAGLFSTSSFE